MTFQRLVLDCGGARMAEDERGGPRYGYAAPYGGRATREGGDGETR
jgi:hypothetical protein